MVYLLHFDPPSKRRYNMMTPLEREYRKLYAQIEKSREPSAWKKYLMKNAYTCMKVICYIHLIVSILDVVYIFSGTAYITSFFTCSYDKETVKDPRWQIIEQVIKLLNYGSHGFFPYPYIFTYTEDFLQFERSYCGTGMCMIPSTDLANFANNCFWLAVTVLRFKAVRTKDLVTFELIYLTDICKIFLEFPDPESFRNSHNNYCKDFKLINVPNTCILIAVIYIEYLYICKLKGESEEMRNKCLGERFLQMAHAQLSEEEKDFEETMKLIPDGMMEEILGL
ncbi:uncharacterized protein LOC121736119 [Aricia agestis]|uniref:uncharacterized protein LOC121736119 n=1 Tax=Aricia agestis TaxID=91739 RepID=UPI001C206849|nr:uncharacterized protein LOC121736119 [Aricia agestis]